MELIEQTPYRFLIPRRGTMRVPGIICSTRALLPGPDGDRSLEQVANVAALPGIVEASYAMPDMHGGYGFPTGGVAATDPARGGVITGAIPKAATLSGLRCGRDETGRWSCAVTIDV
ncbi:MAG TPA: RtcB family protein [Streptosporangiaceae bacterium]|nr:RtcB family protein [Streptosporangiaceae bacterium]